MLTKKLVTCTSRVFKYQLFTSSGTWIRPGGVSEVEVIVIGGAGGGSGYNSGNATERGGDGGLAIHTSLAVTGDVYVTVGTGGSGAPLAIGSGSSGSGSSFSTVSAGGGTGGITQGAFNSEPVHGSGSGGQFNAVSHDIKSLYNNLSDEAKEVTPQLLTQLTSTETLRGEGADTGSNTRTTYSPSLTWVPGTGGKFGNYQQGGSADGGISGAVWVFWYQ
jgi:hypothetical protein